VVSEPLIDLRIFRSCVFNAGMMSGIFLFACYMGVTFVIPLYVENVLGGISPDSGLVMFPATFTALLVNPPRATWSIASLPASRRSHLRALLAPGSVACCFVSEDTPLWLLSV